MILGNTRNICLEDKMIVCRIQRNSQLNGMTDGRIFDHEKEELFLGCKRGAPSKYTGTEQSEI
jgi:hypothetical protein